MSTTFLCIGDPHFKLDNGEDSRLFTQRISELLDQRKPTAVIVMGDTLDRHETIHTDPLCNSINFLAQIAARCPLYLLIGNHDRKNNKDHLSDKHPFTALEHWKNTTVVAQVVKTTIGHLPVTLVPYVFPGRFEEALNSVEGWQESRVIFAHQEFHGCTMNAITSNVGDRWPLNYPLVISGHIHNYQRLQANLIYVGTPYQHSFGEMDRKTVSWFTFVGNEMTEERLELQLPRKRLLDIHWSEVETTEIAPADRCKLVIRGTAAELKAIMKHPKIKLWKERQVKISTKEERSTAPLKESSGRLAKFSVKLNEELQKEPNLRALYEEIFALNSAPPIPPLQRPLLRSTPRLVIE